MQEYIRHHRDLDVWKEAINLVEDVYRLTRDFPSEEKFGLVSQLRRAATSVPANIAEGAGRSGTNEFIRFLYIAQGSITELETHLIMSERLGFGSVDAVRGVEEKRGLVDRLLYGLIRSLNDKR